MKKKNKQSPTDLAILQAIYDEYYLDFIDYDSKNKKNNSRPAKVFVPVDCKLIATKLNIDNDIVFGRLHYHLNGRYSRPNEKVAFFVLGLNNKPQHHIHFPLLASVLADLQNDEKRYKANLYTNKKLTYITFLSAIAAIASVFVAILK